MANKIPGKMATKNIDLENKPKPSVIPIDLLIEVLEPAYREGLIKYSREDWRFGFKTTDMMDAALRHLSAYYYKGEDYDKEAEKSNIKKHHLGAAIFCLICMYDTFAYHPEMDDRFSKNKETIN